MTAGGLLSALALGGCAGGKLPIAPAAPLASFPGNGDPPFLVDVAALAAMRRELGDRLLVLDVSTPRRYRQGHIPGAVHGWWRDTIELNDDLYGVVLQPDNFTDQTDRRRVLTRFGVGSETAVVAYDDASGRWAARIVWFLRFLGHTRAAALDGGLAAWRGAGGSTDRRSNEPPDVSPPTIQPSLGFYLRTDQLLALLDDPATLLLDVRTPAEAHDDVGGRLPRGRIPGSVAFPWNKTLRDDAGRLKSPAELLNALNALGATPDRRLVVVARFGVEAAHSWMVLRLLGFPTVVTYDRGWAGWATTPGLPIAPLNEP